MGFKHKYYQNKQRKVGKTYYEEMYKSRSVISLSDEGITCGFKQVLLFNW